MYSAYTDGSTFILKNVSSVIEIVSTIHHFSNYSGLKSNISKCEIAGIGALKGVHAAVCGLNSVDLTSDTVKILGVHFSYDKEIQNEKTSAR